MAESKTLGATGNQVVAEAMRQCAPDVMAAYPITPQTTIVEEFAKFVAQGKVHTEYVTVESEHSAMSACVGASAAGARVMTATSSQGLALMWEELHIAAGMRLPIVMANANRALSAPINIHCDHSDIMGARDTGWVILFAETAQEAYDNRAYPSKWIGAAERRAARAAANALRKSGTSSSSSLSSPSSPLSLPLISTSYPNTNWTPLGPDGVPVSALIANFSTAGTAATIYSYWHPLRAPHDR